MWIASALACPLALAPPPACASPKPQDTPLQSAALATTGAVVAGMLGAAMTAGSLDWALEDKETDLLEPECTEPGFLGCFDLQVFSDPGPTPLIVGAALTNAVAIGFSAGAGHLWAARDVSRGRHDHRRGVTTTTVGSLMLAAGVGLHVSGWFQQGRGCGGEVSDEDELSCWRTTTREAIAMSTVGALSFDVGAGLVGYGGTTLRATPTFSPSREGASLGLRLAF